MRAGLVVERLTPREFDSMRADWHDLLARSQAGVFQSWEWLHSWWRHLGSGDLWLLAMRRQGRLIGLAPLFRSRYLGLPLRRLRLIGAGASDRLGFILDREFERTAADHFVQYLAHHSGDWEVLDLQQLPEESALAQTAAPTGLRTHQYQQDVLPWLPLPASWDELLGGLSQRFRQNLRYSARRLEREFSVQYRCADSASLDTDLEAFIRLHQARWRERGLPGALWGGRIRGFHRQAAPLLLERGWLKLYSLDLDGESVASLYCLRCGGRVSYYLGGMDPAFARYSPGTVLTAHAIRDAIATGATEFDFLRGDEEYKFAWKPQVRANLRRLFWREAGPARYLPLLLNLERGAESALKSWARGR